jgi:hypothetical protein
MIHAKELRIGNQLLYFMEEENRWEVCEMDWQDIKWCEENPEDFNKCHKPIEISREDLKKTLFSFNIKGLTWEVLKNAYVIYIGGFEFKITFPDNLLWINNGGCTHLKGLHHLKNVLYTLSGITL